MKKLVLFCFLHLSLGLYAQNSDTAKGSKQQWDELDEAFITFFKALENKDNAGFKKISLPVLECLDCVGKPEFNEQGNFVTADVFFINIAGGFKTSRVYKALTERGYTFSIVVIKDFKPKYMPTGYNENDLKLYEVWTPTYKPNELSKGHPGSSHGFQFVKINGKFKFYGLVSIP